MRKPTPGLLFDSGLTIIVVSVIVYIVFAAYYGVSLLHARDKVQQYRVSPGCVADGAPTNLLMDKCTWADYTVRSRDRISKTYHLSLTNSQGLLPDVEVNRRIFRDYPVGSTLQVECWPDIAIAVLDNGIIYRTNNDPYRVLATTRSIFGWGTLIFVLIVGAMSVQLIVSTRLLVAARPPEFIDYSLDMKPIGVQTDPNGLQVTKTQVDDDEDGDIEYQEWG